MIATLRGRVTGWAGLLGGLMVVGAAAVTFVLWPAFRRADRALEPFDAIFPVLAERQAAVVSGIDRLARRLDVTTSPIDTTPWRPPTIPSLLATYAGALTPEAAVTLAAVDEDLAGLEAQLGLAYAALESGGRARARAVLQGVRQREAGLALRQRDQMAVALRTGAEARAEVDKALSTATRLALLWLGLVTAAVGLLAWDLRRHVLLPVQALQEGVERLSRGDWSRNVAEVGDIELRRLARHFNGMVEILRRRAGRQAQFATAGELLSGAAHELNNPLQTLQALAELRRGMATGQEAADWEAVYIATTRAARLVHDLGHFARTSRPTALVRNLNAIIRSAMNLVQFQFAADGIEVQLDLSERLPPVLCDDHDLVQALVNLLSNAHAAVRGRPQPRRVTVTSWRADDAACVRIQDTGPGVPVDVRAHIFDPFFTTKDDGAGLGLPSARDIIEGEGGRIVLDDTITGASFTIRLPAAPGLQVDAPPVPPPVVATTGNGRSLEGLRVLVVDDESAVRDVMRRFLEREGARPVLAGGGEEALRWAERQEFDAVLLDLRMPDIEGARVYDRWARERPGLAERTLILSGDLSRLDTSAPVPAHRILTKPIELATLREALLALRSVV
ncbi:MAG: hybrid sensor histidine kinase/response regulator [Gemmatimonadales bacterium]